MKRSGSGVHIFGLAFEHTEDILNTDFSCFWYLYRRTLWQSYVCAVTYNVHFCFGGDLTKPAITIASVERFYLNLVICLQLDIALLVQNAVKVRHCLPELWQCIEGDTFSRSISSVNLKFHDKYYIKCAGCIHIRTAELVVVHGASWNLIACTAFNFTYRHIRNLSVGF